MLYPYSPTATTPHVQASSSGTADVQTLTPPEGARAALITVETTNCYLTADGSTPSATNGLQLVKDGLPFLLPVPQPLKFASEAAAASKVNVLWIR